jgi:hypothetical protein
MRFALGMVCTTLLLVMSAPASAAPEPRALGAQLAANAPACGTFAQTRWLADLEFEVKSRGEFQRRGRALIWHTKTPVDDRVVLSEDNDELPADLQVMLPILTGLLSGEWEPLRRHFSIALGGSLSAWQARLTARDSAVADKVSRVLVRGGLRVESVEIAFAEGDRLSLTLTPGSCP